MELGSPSHLQRERRGEPAGRTAAGRASAPRAAAVLGPAEPGWPWVAVVHATAPDLPAVTAGTPPSDPTHLPWLLHVSPAAGDICSCFSLSPGSPGRRCSFNFSESSGRSKTFFSGSHGAASSPDCIEARGSALSAVSDPAVSSFLGRDVPIPVGFIHPSAGPTECGSFGAAFGSAFLETSGQSICTVCVGKLPLTP